MTPNLTAKYPMPEFNRQNQMRVGVRACGTGRQNIRGAEVRWGRGGGGAIQREKDGERYKKIYLKYAGIYVDLFLVLPPAMWGVQMVIRMGPADFSHWIVTRRNRGGAMQNGFRVQDGAVWRGEHGIKNPEVETRMGFETERQFFDFLGLDWIEPKDRVARWSK
jgi:DNA polymerase/3'-5' exonuclease PolX